jgi:SAM-dependent methyltransferase
MTGTQYDKIGDEYNNVGILLTAILSHVAIQTYAGNVRGLDVLDLGCGTGFYSRKFIESGANKVVGVDNSEAMLESARRQAVVSGLFEFHVADASEPLHLGEFDLVLAVWILTYASNEGQLLSIWRNIYNGLRPGGRCIGIVHDPNLVREAESPEERFGPSTEFLTRAQGGVRGRTTLHTSHPVSFNQYIVELSMHEKYAIEAGFSSIQWMPPVDPQIPGLDFASFVERPIFQVFVVSRSSCEN